MNDYYRILELPDRASLGDVRQAYRRLAKLYHPDVNKSPDAHQKFCEISEAYEFLTNHWPQHSDTYTSNADYQQKYREYQYTAAYEQFRREAQERARRQARMRYEKFRKQHEAFQESGLNDIVLLFTIFMRVFSLVLFLALFTIPLILAIFDNWSWIFTVLFLWPFAGGLAWYYYDNRKNYFQPGTFYYSFARIRQVFTEKHTSTEKCFYCKNLFADSKPYKVELLKLKDVKFGSEGFRQHNVNYINKNLSLFIPRSQKALIVQSIAIAIKILSVAVCLIFLNVSSTAFKIIIGLTAGGIISGILFLLSGTRSNVSYLVNYNHIIRVFVWIVALSLATKFYFNPFNAVSRGEIYFAIFGIVIFDSFLMQLVTMVLGKYSFYSLFPQHPEFEARIKDGYILYNDIPALSFFYPVLKWIFG